MDQLYKDLVPGGEESVHYVLMPDYDESVIDKDLEADDGDGAAEHRRWYWPCAAR